MSEPLPDAQIISLDDPYVAGAAITSFGQADPIFVLPFRDERLERAFVLDSHTILFAAKEPRPGQGTQLAKFDLTTTSITARSRMNGRPDALVLSRDRRTLYSLDRGVSGASTDTLAPIVGYDVLFEESGRLARSDSYYTLDRTRKSGEQRVYLTYELQAEFESLGALHLFPEAKVTHESADGRRLVFADGYNRVFEVDIKAGTGCRLGGEMPWWSHIQLLDADHRIVIANDATLPLSDGQSADTCTIFGHAVPNVRNHPDLAADGKYRFGAVLSVHLLEDGKKFLPVVRMATAADWRQTRQNMSDEELQDHLCLTAAKIAYPDDKGLQVRHLMRFDPARQKETIIADTSVDVRHKGLGALLDVLCLTPNGDAVWLWFKDGHLRRVSLDGTLGPLIGFDKMAPLDRWERKPTLNVEPDGTVVFSRDHVGTYRFHPDRLPDIGGRMTVTELPVPHPKGVSYWEPFRAFVVGHLVPIIAVPSWSEAGCQEALRAQASLVDRGYDNLLIGDQHGRFLKFVYTIGTEQLSEMMFFQRIIESQFNVATELRTLLETYLPKLGKGDEGVQPWQERGGRHDVAGLGSAMRALALLDPSTLGILRWFMDTRDREHENYCWGVIVPDVCSRHGLHEPAHARFAVFAMLNAFSGGLSLGTDPHGLLTAIGKHFDASNFAHIVRAEIDERCSQFGIEEREKVRAWSIREIVSILDRQDPVQREVATLLEAQP